jgi:hypothetical protein
VKIAKKREKFNTRGADSVKAKKFDVP